MNHEPKMAEECLKTKQHKHGRLRRLNVEIAAKEALIGLDIDKLCYIHPLLHPFLMQVRRENPGPLVEDNAGSQATTAKHDAMTAELREHQTFHCK